MFGDAVDTAIAAIGLIRRVVLWPPDFLAVGDVVSRTVELHPNGEKNLGIPRLNRF